MNIKSLTEPDIDTTTPMGRALFGIVAVFAQLRMDTIPWATMVMLRFPLDEPSANQYELAGRFIAATIWVERVLDAVLLHYVAQDPVNATTNVRKVLRRLTLDAKCDLLAEFVEQQQETHAYSELPAKVKRVVQHRHRFAHMLVTRDERGGLHFLDELTKTRQSFTAEQQATIEREALEAQQDLASLVNSVAAV